MARKAAPKTAQPSPGAVGGKDEKKKKKKTKKKKDLRVKRFLEQHPISAFRDALDAAEPRPPQGAMRAVKKNYAQYLSEATAVLVANELRAAFPEILPRADGTGQESRARTGKGIKKLDVNYSTPQLGLGLGISIKTLNFRDPKTRRYTKNPTRLDNELRAEAMDYHQRQPYAVLIAFVFVPVDSCDDGNRKRARSSRSSFAQVVNVLRHRGNREEPNDDLQLLEAVFVGLYRHEGEHRGETLFFDTRNRVPQFGMPPNEQLLTFDQVLNESVSIYDRRNNVKPAWESDDEAAEPRAMAELIQNELLPPEEDSDDEADEDTSV